MKKCSKCKTLKYLSDFYLSSRYKDGHGYVCKTCVIFCSKEYGIKNREKIRKRRKDNPERHILINAKNRAKKRRLEFNLAIEDIIIPEVCPILGIPLFPGTNRLIDNSPSLDRIDNTLGYIKGNIVIISWRANALKKDGTLEEIEKLYEWMRRQ